MKRILKAAVRLAVPKRVRAMRELLIRCRPQTRRQCPICEFWGWFDNFGRPPRLDAQCPQCGSLERHRLLWLWLSEESNAMEAPVLHFAPEKILEARFRKRLGKTYFTADLFAPADRQLDIEAIALESQTIATVICNHVLEHVDDARALSEIFRILKPGGILIVSVPIIEGWAQTYEDLAVLTPKAREVHFGQSDHVRYYGNDFRDRLGRAGFSIREITAQGADVVRYGLWRGEKLFVCSKT